MHYPAHVTSVPNPLPDTTASLSPFAEASGLILIVDDDPQALKAIRSDLASAQMTNQVISFSSGREAMDYLGGTGQFKDRYAFPLPGLLVVDWRMPLISGLEIINFVRSKLKSLALPIVVLTASTDLDDMREAYNAGATSYLVKPLSTYNVAKMFAVLMAG